MIVMANMVHHQHTISVALSSLEVRAAGGSVQNGIMVTALVAASVLFALPPPPGDRRVVRVIAGDFYGGQCSREGSWECVVRFRWGELAGGRAQARMVSRWRRWKADGRRCRAAASTRSMGFLVGGIRGSRSACDKRLGKCEERHSMLLQ